MISNNLFGRVAFHFLPNFLCTFVNAFFGIDSVLSFLDYCFFWVEFLFCLYELLEFDVLDLC